MGAAAIMPAISAVTGVLGFVQQRSAAKKAERLGEENARRAAAESQESARRLEITQKRSLATARARAGSSGFDITGGDSMGDYIDELSSQYSSELDWLRKSGASAASIERRRGDIAASSARAGGWSSLLKGGGEVANWWAG